MIGGLAVGADCQVKLVQRPLDCGNLKKENFGAILRASGPVSLSWKGRGTAAACPKSGPQGSGEALPRPVGEEGAVFYLRARLTGDAPPNLETAEGICFLPGIWMPSAT